MRPITRALYKDGGVDLEGNPVNAFDRLEVVTDEGSCTFGSKCSFCGTTIMPRITKEAGEVKSHLWCSKCKVKK